MHEKKLPHGLENPWLQEDINGLPLDGLTREESLEKMSVPARLPQKKWYQSVAREMRKRNM